MGGERESSVGALPARGSHNVELDGTFIPILFKRLWADAEQEYIDSFEEFIAQANYEQAANALALSMTALVLSGQPIPLNTYIERYNSVRVLVDTAGRYMLDLPLQYEERVKRRRSSVPPWVLEGEIVTEQDTESRQDDLLHLALRHTLALRLAIFYDAPLSEQRRIVEEGREAGLVSAEHLQGIEWTFLIAIVAIRTGEHDDDVRTALWLFDSESEYVHSRLELLRALQQLHDGGMDDLKHVERAIDKLEAMGEPQWAGLLSYYAGLTVLDATKSKRLASGFFCEASASYRQTPMAGVCDMLHEELPSICPAPPPPGPLPSQALGIAETARSAERARDRSGSTTSTGPRLVPASAKLDRRTSASNRIVRPDALSMLHSLLNLASEQDPSILLSTLMGLICQYVDADYAAVALCDERDRSIVRLRAAGLASQISPYDMALTDENAKSVCPASLISFTARTGKAITTPHESARIEKDPYFDNHPPSSLICVPISTQGRQYGVLLLSSQSSRERLNADSTNGVVATLATFTTLFTSNVSISQKLKLEVDNRTKDLQNALAAKTQFLSQCSHELRSPLSAVLGLAAVLEASSGLSEVQREHLRTIISSGEDLLGLINNILDQSKLESGSVALEHIPFTLRDVVEGALDSVAAVTQKKKLEICLISPFDSDPPAMVGDPFRIKQILLNLLSNAVKFTQEGRVTVQWRWEAVEDQKIRVEMDVEDTGIGIPASKMDKLFRNFSQTDESITRSFGGSGLGLIISKDLAKLLGGDCTATSEYGKGSKFTFSLCADRDLKEQPQVARFPTPKSCFIICDPGPWWDMLEANLRVLNCQPVRFTDTVKDSIVKGHPDGLNSDKKFDFILVNTQMVTRSVLAEMRKLQPESKMLYLVRSIDLAKTIRDFDITRESIISRPIKFASLVRAMIPPKDGGSSSKTQEANDRGKRRVNSHLAHDRPLDILLVDDNQVNVTVGKRILEMFGYKDVSYASDGQQAIQKAEQKQYDLILLDLQMPVLDGFKAQKRIKASELAGDPCVVALTANADQRTQEMCANAEFFDYLSKPLDIPKLERILGEVYEYRRHHHLTLHPNQESKVVDQEKGNC